MCKSVESFKVLTECPFIAMLLFQLYPKYIKINIPVLVVPMISALSEHYYAYTFHTEDDKEKYKDFIAAQVILIIKL